MKNKFLEKVAEQIEDKRSREIITAELESHLLDKIDYYVDIGYSKEEALSRSNIIHLLRCYNTDVLLHNMVS